jgi:hypothetical protein
MIPPQIKESASFGSTKIKPYVPLELNIGATLLMEGPNVSDVLDNGLPRVSSLSSTDLRIVFELASQDDPKFEDTMPIPNLAPAPTPPVNKLRIPTGTLPLDSPLAVRSIPSIHLRPRLCSTRPKSGSHLYERMEDQMNG